MTTIDQFASSLQNFALLIFTAREVPSLDFGAFSLTLTLIVLVLNFMRASVSEPIMLNFSSDDSIAGHEDAVGAGATLTTAIALIIAGIFGCSAVAASGPLRSALEGAAIVIAPLLGLDYLRWMQITLKSAGRLLTMDVLWIAFWILGLVVVRPNSARGEIVLWGGTALVGYIPPFLKGVRVKVRALPPSAALQFARARLRSTSASLLGEYIAGNGATQIVSASVAGFLGLRATGGLRGGNSLLGPSSTLINAIRVGIVPEVLRAGGSRTTRGRNLLIATTALCVALTVVVVVVVVTIPVGVGRSLLGDTWPLAHRLLIPIGITYLAGAFATRSQMSMRADRNLRGIRRSQFGASLLSIAVVPLVAILGDVESVAWAIAGVTLVNLGIYEFASRTYVGLQPPQAE